MNSQELSRISMAYFNEGGDAIYCVGSDGKLLFVNQKFCTQLGYTEDELLGMYIWSINSLLGKEYWEKHFNNVRKKGVVTINTFHCNKSGQLLHVEATQSYLKTDERELYVAHARYPKPNSQSALSGSFTEFEAIFDAFPDLLFKLATDGTILYYKAGAATELFLTPEEFLGKKIQDVVPEKIARKFDEHLQKASANSNIESFEYYLKINGEIKWFEARVVPFDTETVVAVIRDITLKHRAENALRHSERLYKVLAGNMPNGAIFMFDKNLKFYLAEGQALQEIGFPKELIEGKTLEELHLPQVFKRKATRFCLATLKGNKVNFEMRVYGNRIFYCTGIPITNIQQEIEGGMIVAFDITKQKNTEQELSRRVRELKESEKLYRALVQNIPNGVLMIFDNQLRCTLAEGQVLQKFGYTKEKMIGRTPDEIFPEDMSNELIPQYEAALKGQSITFEMKTKSTNHAYLVSILPLLGINNKNNGGMIVAFDIDHLKAVEDELQQRVTELSRLNERLNKEVDIRKKIEANLQEYTNELKLKNQELEQFAYVASHDLQEPLRMISSFTQLLGRKYHDKLDKEAEEYIAFTIEGSTRMQQLINDLLAYSRIGTRGKEFVIINFEEIIKKAIYNLSLTMRETGAEINYSDMPDIKGDDSQLVQLIQNLISNAIKFRKEGVKPVITITAKEEPTHFLFSVKDNGIGIAPEHKERIFQIFQRLHTRDKYPGTGIGLAICKKIVERHNGEIWVESTPGQGTAFLFTLKR